MEKMKKLSVLLAAVFTGLCLFMVGCNDTPLPENPELPSGDDEGTVWTIPEDSWSYSNRIMYVRDLGYATGINAFTDTRPYNMTGTDLGFAFFDDEIDRLYVAFGDTNNTATSNGQREWNSNVILYTDNLDFTKGIFWEGALPGQNGSTRTVTPITQSVANVNRQFWGDVEVGDVTCSKVSTCIPTGALVLNGVYYMWYMEVGAFEATGEWDVYRNCVVKSSDQGQTWTKVEGLEWISKDADEKEGVAPNFGQIYPMDGDDGYIYIYGIPGGRSGGVKLGRVKYEDIEDFESYEYYKKTNDDGTVDWRQGTNGLRSVKADTNSFIVMPMCGELSVCYNPYLQRYVMTYMQNNSKIVLRRSATPWGTWSDADTIMSQSDLPELYGGLGHASMMTNDGQRMYLFVSEWTTYNVHLIEVVFN